jgi:hypothetical protein
MYDFLKAHWVAGAAFIAAALLAFAPVLAREEPVGLWLIFLHSPGYMIHQVEEHYHDRFRAFVNQTMFGGREALTTGDVIAVNVGGVWFANFAALYAAQFVGLGWGLTAPYLMLVNVVGHVGQTIGMRRYNPGLVTSVAIFLPLGVTTLVLVPGSAAQQVLGLAIALLIHLAIAVRVLSRLRGLPRAA